MCACVRVIFVCMHRVSFFHLYSGQTFSSMAQPPNTNFQAFGKVLQQNLFQHVSHCSVKMNLKLATHIHQPKPANLNTGAYLVHDMTKLMEVGLHFTVIQ